MLQEPSTSGSGAQRRGQRARDRGRGAGRRADMAAAERPEAEVSGSGLRGGARRGCSGPEIGCRGAGGLSGCRGARPGVTRRCALRAAGGGGRARLPPDEEGLPHLPQRAARLGPQPAPPGHLGRARARAGEWGPGSAAGMGDGPASWCVLWLGVMSLACLSLLVVEVRKRAGCAQHPAQWMAAG